MVLKIGDKLRIEKFVRKGNADTRVVIEQKKGTVHQITNSVLVVQFNNYKESFNLVQLLDLAGIYKKINKQFILITDGEIKDMFWSDRKWN